MEMPKNVYMEIEDLDYYVRNKANLGDILIAKDRGTQKEYVYFCYTKDSIGENANPYWSEWTI